MVRKWIFLVLFILISGCTGAIINYSSCFPVDLNSKIAVIPFVNNTETPLAGERAMSITAAVLESSGACCVSIYNRQNYGKTLFPGMNREVSRSKLLSWARSIHARYAMTGSVNEWTYKVGLDGEPVVGIALQLVDLYNSKVVWTGVGSLSKGSRIAVSTTAQELINGLLQGLYSSNCPSVGK